MENQLIIASSYVVTFALGLGFGSWLYYRGRSNASPVPSLPRLGKEKAEDNPFKLPEVKP